MFEARNLHYLALGRHHQTHSGLEQILHLAHLTAHIGQCRTGERTPIEVTLHGAFTNAELDTLPSGVEVHLEGTIFEFGLEESATQSQG